MIINSLGLHKPHIGYDTKKRKKRGVFILCIHCLRMVCIVVPCYSRLASLLSPGSGFSFAVGVCRTCANLEAVTEETYSVPYKIIESTHMYRYACIVARKKLPIAEEQNVFVDVALNDPGCMIIDCRIYGVRTDDALSKLTQLDRDELLLDHVPKGFF